MQHLDALEYTHLCKNPDRWTLLDTLGQPCNTLDSEITHAGMLQPPCSCISPQWPLLLYFHYPEIHHSLDMKDPSQTRMGDKNPFTGKRDLFSTGNMHWKVDEHLKYLNNFPKRKYSLEIWNFPTIFWSGEFSSIFDICLEYSDPGYAWNI